MKKLLSLVAAAALTFSMAACGSTNNGSDTIDQSGDTIQTPSAQAVKRDQGLVQHLKKSLDLMEKIKIH